MKLVIILIIVLVTSSLLLSAQGEVESLKTDKRSYVQTDKIIFYGTADVNDTGREINLQITGPHGNYIDTFTTTAGVNGSFQIILNTNILKIQTEFAQPGTYDAIAFIQIRSSTPAIFDYSPIPPPPPRPFVLKQIPLSKNETHIAASDLITHNKSNITSSAIKTPSIGKQNQSITNNMLSKYPKSTNATISSQSSKILPIIPNPVTNTQKLVKQTDQQLQGVNKNQFIANQYDDQQKIVFIKSGATIAAIIGIIILIIRIEGRKKNTDPNTTSSTQERGSLYGVSYHPYSHDGVRIHYESCRHVINHSQKGATRWFFIRGYQNAKSQAENISSNQNTYWKNAQCCLNRIIINSLGVGIFLSLIPFLGILGGLLIREYYPTFGKGLMYFGLFYGTIASIWIL